MGQWGRVVAMPMPSATGDVGVGVAAVSEDPRVGVAGRFVRQLRDGASGLFRDGSALPMVGGVNHPSRR
jgi:hypothetical protein